MFTKLFDTIPDSATVKDIHGIINEQSNEFVVIDYSEGIKQLNVKTGPVYGQGIAQIRTAKRRAGSIFYEVKAIYGPCKGQVLVQASTPINAFIAAYDYAQRAIA